MQSRDKPARYDRADHRGVNPLATINSA